MVVVQPAEVRIGTLSWLKGSTEGIEVIQLDHLLLG
jgi:hypothetical protein